MDGVDPVDPESAFDPGARVPDQHHVDALLPPGIPVVVPKAGQIFCEFRKFAPMKSRTTKEYEILIGANYIKLHLKMHDAYFDRIKELCDRDDPGTEGELASLLQAQEHIAQELNWQW